MNNLLNQNPGLKDQLLQLMAQGHLQEALQCLVESGYTEGKVLQKQLDANNHQFKIGVIGFNDLARVQNRIAYAVLTSLYASENDSVNDPHPHSGVVAQTYGPVPHALVQTLIRQRKTLEALNLCHQLGGDSILLNARYHNALKLYQGKLIGQTDLEQVQEAIHNALLEMIKKAPDGDPGLNPNARPVQEAENWWTNLKRRFS